MEDLIKTRNMMDMLNREKIETWFELGIFIDRFRENLRSCRNEAGKVSYKEFCREIENGGLAFLTYSFSVDGVSIEIQKYASVIQNSFPGIRLHFIAGEMHPEAGKLISGNAVKKVIPEARGFDNWSLYHDFFFKRLERGSPDYNRLISELWNEVKDLALKIGSYLEKENIALLFPVNVFSNPGNVSLAIALVLVSESFGMPVINNCHDYYWEGGNRCEEIKTKNLKKGPRDFFFNNSHLGEVFTLLEVFYPWESDRWITLNINGQQTDHIIRINGHNPAAVTEIGTAVDIEKYTTTNKRIKINTFYQFEQILSRYRQTLVAYSVHDTLSNQLVSKETPRPILVSGQKTKPLKHFLAENIIFLQPTRIIARKNIELSFKLVKKLFNQKHFTDKFAETDNLKLSIIVTGPIACGHYDYFIKLLVRFSKLVETLPEIFRDKIYLAFLFSEPDRDTFKQRFENPVGIPELYNIASLVLLPSKTEGRGLPIIEAAACGVPVFCRRYEPRNVYSEVIGELLGEEDRLKVIEFEGSKIKREHTEAIINRVFFPHLFQGEVLHNQQAVKKRFSLQSISCNFDDVFYRLYFRLYKRGKNLQLVKSIVEKYRKQIFFRNELLKQLLQEENRKYIAGFGKLCFMQFLKSLIDPSYFRVEEQYIRGQAMAFAREMLSNDPGKNEIPEERISDFFQAVDELFLLCEDDFKKGHDHSFAYRHRGRNHYAWYDFTIQEITGLINILYRETVKPLKTTRVLETSHFFTDWNLALAQLTSSSHLAIDDRKWLFERMKANVPMVIFAGRYVSHELEIFALQSIRSRLKLELHEELKREMLEKQHGKIAPVYVFAQEKPVRNWPEVNEIEKYIRSGRSGELKLLHEFGLVKIVPVKQWSMGIHIPQLGKKALEILCTIRKKEGLIITHRKDSVVMSDILDIDRLHIGKVEDPVTAGMMGIPEGSGFIIYLPAGLRPCLAYPTPVQTARDFHEALNSALFERLSVRFGKKRLIKMIKSDAETKGTPIKKLLRNIDIQEDNSKNRIKPEFISGLYDDRNPWNGVVARVNTTTRGKRWEFRIVNSGKNVETADSLAKRIQKETGHKVDIAWNGGYILNAELVGKLGLPETYIGTPLGLIISDGEVYSLPLFNKPAFIVEKDGKISIRRVNLGKGLELSDGSKHFLMGPECRNCKIPGETPVFYDLMYPEREIITKDRVVLRMAGNRIVEVISDSDNEKTKLIPVGITLSFPKGKLPESWSETGKKLKFVLPEMVNVKHAIEAGPLLVKNGDKALDMELEGWKTAFSVATQAARIDYTDLRGPKIAAGIDKQGNLAVVAINGRIRESVGATHFEMCDILLKNGILDGMGFDPGGSSTLVVDGQTLNISPYNRRYAENVYSLPPEPRAVSNAVTGSLIS